MPRTIDFSQVILNFDGQPLTAELGDGKFQILTLGRIAAAAVNWMASGECEAISPPEKIRRAELAIALCDAGRIEITDELHGIICTRIGLSCAPIVVARAYEMLGCTSTYEQAAVADAVIEASAATRQ